MKKEIINQLDNLKNPKVVFVIVLFFVLCLISYSMLKNEIPEPKTEDIIFKSILPSLVISFIVGFCIYFYTKKSNELVFYDRDFYDT